MTAQLSPVPIFRAWSPTGEPLAYGILTTLAAGTTIKQATYVDSTQTTQNSNPIRLDAFGQCALWLDPSLTYKFVLTDNVGNTIPGYPVDNIPGGFGALPSSASLIPSPTNTWTLGNSSFSWANIYLGANAAPAYDVVTGNIGYYALTTAEIAAGITPTDFVYPPYDARRYGAKGDGATDDTIALTQWITVLNEQGYQPAQSFKKAYLPSTGAGYLITSGLPAITTSNFHLYGDGADVSRIICGGNGPYVALQVGSNPPTTTLVVQPAISDLSLVRFGGSGAVSLLRVFYTQYGSFERITLYDNTGVGASQLTFGGHENNTFYRIRIQGEQPISLVNPNAGIDPLNGSDHTVFRDIELLSQTDVSPLINVIAPIGLSKLKFLGTEVWLGGSAGFYWDDNGAGTGNGVGDGLVFENIRREQASGLSNGDTIHISPGTTDFIGTLSVRDCTMGLATNLTGGIYTRRVRQQIFENLLGSVSGVGINTQADSNYFEMVMSNVNFDPAHMTLTNFERVVGDDDLMSSVGNRTCIYQWTDGPTGANAGNKGCRIYEGRDWDGFRTVANGAAINIPGSATSVGIVLVCGRTGTNEGGLVLCAGSSTTLVSGTTNFTAAIASGKLSVSWNSGSGTYIVTNNLGVQVVLMIKDIWMM